MIKYRFVLKLQQKRSVYYRKQREKVFTNFILPIQRRFQIKRFMVQGEIINKKCGRKFKVNSKYYQQKVLRPKLTESIPFHYPNGFIEWNFIKKKQQVILQKVVLHSLKKWRLLQVLNVYLKILLQSPLMFHLWTIEHLVYWKRLFLSVNPPQLMEFVKLWERIGNQ